MDSQEFEFVFIWDPSVLHKLGYEEYHNCTFLAIWRKILRDLRSWSLIVSVPLRLAGLLSEFSDWMERSEDNFPFLAETLEF